MFMLKSPLLKILGPPIMNKTIHVSNKLAMRFENCKIPNHANISLSLLNKIT